MGFFFFFFLLLSCAFRIHHCFLCQTAAHSWAQSKSPGKESFTPVQQFVLCTAETKLHNNRKEPVHSLFVCWSYLNCCNHFQGWRTLVIIHACIVWTHRPGYNLSEFIYCCKVCTSNHRTTSTTTKNRHNSGSLHSSKLQICFKCEVFMARSSQFPGITVYGFTQLLNVSLSATVTLKGVKTGVSHCFYPITPPSPPPPSSPAIWCKTYNTTLFLLLLHTNFNCAFIFNLKLEHNYIINPSWASWLLFWSRLFTGNAKCSAYKSKTAAIFLHL